MNKDEEIINLDELDTELSENEYEDEGDDFEEEEPQVFMNVIAALGVIIALAAIICIVFLFLKSGKEQEENYVGTVETEQETVSEEQTANENIENESFTDILLEETVISDIEQKDETEDNEIQETSSGIKETSQSETVNTQEAPISGNESMEFTETSDTVTAKIVTNLRSVPSTLDEGNIVSQLLNGETVSRTGINDMTGWSRLEYNGQTVYAMSYYLTTDLNYKPPVAPGDPNRVTTQDGRVIIFTNHDDYITPKEYVNLRIEPSTSEGESTVRYQLHNGETVHRTGYSLDSGWSRVEYNGETLYVVSSMIYSTEAVIE